MVGYVIRPGFLSAGLVPKTELQEEQLARPYFPVHMPEADEDTQTRPPVRPRTFRAIALASDIQQEFDLYEQFAPRHRAESNPTSNPLPQIQWRRDMARPPCLDDDKPVPPPEIGGLSTMWSMANTLTGSLSEHLQGLKDEHTNDTSAGEGSNSNMVKQLIDRFEIDKKALEHVRKICLRTYYLNALQELPPYYDAVLTLRTRLNCWLAAWNAHKERKQGRQTDNDIQDMDDTVEEHLKDWLGEVDRLPKYPENMPLYIEPNTPQILPGCCLLPQTKPEEKPAESPMENGVLDPLDLRTPTRRVFDHRARQRET